ncbi:hypothetical protein DNK06_12375 [Pseudomonas daroniae]|uniref:Uncharacterized protein n=1 Tax=Phytopseudomonas daroniae TaxID=2487519 RepID=A0A4Q9QLE5_9GAMM|nr:hypothetical protein DNK06_12375 [Pseudomonas daroniae]TBU82414.1 hypothetical protein DNK31_11025 [Pseudomonas sp. FRB 228]TBU91873.1 hypothetical protein DNJ99_09895 [Pseudomonas daroniae]
MLGTHENPWDDNRRRASGKSVLLEVVNQRVFFASAELPKPLFSVGLVGFGKRSDRLGQN